MMAELKSEWEEHGGVWRSSARGHATLGGHRADVNGCVSVPGDWTTRNTPCLPEDTETGRLFHFL